MGLVLPHLKPDFVTWQELQTSAHPAWVLLVSCCLYPKDSAQTTPGALSQGLQS